MTDPPPPPESLNIKQAHFVREHAHGAHASAEAAAKYVGYSAKRARQTASAILARPDAKAYLAALQTRTEKECDMKRGELAQFYADIIRAKPQDADEANPLCLPVYLKEETAFTYPDKLGAGDRLMNLMGWNAQEDKANEAKGSVLEAILGKRDI